MLKVSGIGDVSEQILKSLGVQVCSDLRDKRGLLRLLFSSTSYWHFLRISLGLGSTHITPAEDRDRKSISTETTFKGTSDSQVLLNMCSDLCQELAKDMEKRDLFGKVFTLKIKTTNFEVRTRAHSLLEHTRDPVLMTSACHRLLNQELPLSLRLIGVRMSNFAEKKGTQRNIKDLFSHQPVATPASSSSSSPSTSSCSSSSSSKIVDKEDFSCPICNQTGFHDLGTLNSHVDECLNQGLVKELVRDSKRKNPDSEPDSHQTVTKRRKNSNILTKFLGL